MSKPYDLELSDAKLNAREKIAIILVLFIINLLKPWKYSHQQEEFYTDLYTLMGLSRKDNK